MPAVMTSAQFDARTEPLRRNLLLLARRAVGPNDAPDVVQEALLTASTRLHSFNAACDQPAFLAWLQSILAFEINHKIRQQVCLRETLLPSITLFEMCDGPDAPAWEDDQWLAQREEMYRRVHALTLTPRQRECTLRWLSGESLRAIGSTLTPRVSAEGVRYIIGRVGCLIKEVDNADFVAGDVGESLRNMPAALTYDGQIAFNNRVIREANQYAIKQAMNLGRRG